MRRDDAETVDSVDGDRTLSARSARSARCLARASRRICSGSGSGVVVSPLALRVMPLARDSPRAATLCSERGFRRIVLYCPLAVGSKMISLAATDC